MKFLQAKNFNPSNRETVLLVCVHTMEAPEGPATAENVAAYFANQPKHGTIDPKWCRKHPTTGQILPWSGCSAHYNVDANSIVQSVLEKDVAWHAGPINGYSIGVEHAGYARQTPEEWADEASIAILERSSVLVADICRRYTIPVQRVTGFDLKAGRRNGICGHFDVTYGLCGGRGHTDPGRSFPWEFYLDRIRAHLVSSSPDIA